MVLQVRRAVAWTVASQIILFCVQFGGQIALAHILSPYEIGIYAAGFAVTGVVSAIQTFGLGSLVVREQHVDGNLIRTIFTINALLSVSVAFSIFVSSFLLGSFLHDFAVTRVIRFLAVLPLLGIFELCPAAFLQRDMRFGATAMASAARTLVTTAATLILALLGQSYMSLAWGALAGACINIGIINFVGRKYSYLGFGLREWRKVTNFGFQMMAISGVTTLSDRVSDVILGHFLGLSLLGVYSRASSIISLLWQNVYLVFARVGLSALSEQRRTGTGSLRSGYLIILSNMTAVLWPFFAGLAVMAAPLVRLVYGVTWLQAAAPLSILAVSAMVLTTITMAWEVFVVCGETRTQAKFEFIRAAFNVLAFTVGSMLGFLAAAFSRVVSAAFSQVLYAPHLARMTDTRSSEFTPIYIQSLLLTLMAIVPSVAVMAIYHWSAETPILLLAASTVLGVLLWLATIMLSKHPLANELTHIMGLVNNNLRLKRPAIT